MSFGVFFVRFGGIGYFLFGFWVLILIFIMFVV